MAGTLKGDTPTTPTDPTTPTAAAANDKTDPQVIDALTIGTVKTTAESASLAMANLFQNQANVARRIDSLTEACLGKMLKKFAFTNPIEAVSVAKIFQGESDSSIGSLLAQLSSGQESAKIAQSTPGDLASEISKMGAAVASLNGLIGGIVAILQETIKGAMTTPQVSMPSAPVAPAPTPAPVQTMPSSVSIAPYTVEEANAINNPVPAPSYNPPSWPSKTFPSVTIKY